MPIRQKTRNKICTICMVFIGIVYCCPMTAIKQILDDRYVSRGIQLFANINFHPNKTNLNQVICYECIPFLELRQRRL